MSDSENRNPLIIPRAEEVTSGCGKCHKNNWLGRNIGGQYTFTCQECGHKWYGGLPQEPADPRIPVPPLNPRDIPTVRFDRDPRKNEYTEIRRRPNLMQPFRGGLPFPKEGED